MFCSGAENIAALRAPGVLVDGQDEVYRSGRRKSEDDKLQLSTNLRPSGCPPWKREMRALMAAPEPAVAAHYGMMQYHMGWMDAQFQPQALPAGKRLRPLLCLLACAEVGGAPGQALPAAAAIEILHNFSLVHDDVEDGDETRRHRATVWKLWGVPQAVNVGDGMFALAFAAMQRLPDRGVAPATTLAALQLFTATCLALTEGQHLDMRFEQQAQVTVDEYLRMIQGKTAALIGASVAIGAVIGGASAGPGRGACSASARRWGWLFRFRTTSWASGATQQVTGKAAGNDILRKKKSLPMLHALNHPTVGPRFAALAGGGSYCGGLACGAGVAGGSRDAPVCRRASAALARGGGQGALGEALGEQAGESALLQIARQPIGSQFVGKAGCRQADYSQEGAKTRRGAKVM